MIAAAVGDDCSVRAAATTATIAVATRVTAASATTAVTTTAAPRSEDTTTTVAARLVQRRNPRGDRAGVVIAARGPAVATNAIRARLTALSWRPDLTGLAATTATTSDGPAAPRSCDGLHHEKIVGHEKHGRRLAALTTIGVTAEKSRRAALGVAAACAAERSAADRTALSDDDDKRIARPRIEGDTTESAAAAGDKLKEGETTAAASAP